jgi:hypothetical protein
MEDQQEEEEQKKEVLAEFNAKGLEMFPGLALDLETAQLTSPEKDWVITPMGTIEEIIWDDEDDE